MTIPKFESVAWRYELKASEYTFAEKRYLNETYAPRPTALYTAEQLAEAYEAWKREATPEWQPIETAPRGVLEILLRSPNGKISNGYWGQECNRGKGAWVWPYVKSEPSHWMPLPAAPKGEA